MPQQSRITPCPLNPYQSRGLCWYTYTHFTEGRGKTPILPCRKAGPTL